jgi:predicted ester cyclase
MDADGLKGMYTRWLTEVWGEGRLDVNAELVADDIVDHNCYKGQPDGRAGQDWAVRMVRKSFPDLKFHLDVVVTEEEYVTGRWTMTGTNTGVLDLFNLPPTGRPVVMTGQEIFRVADGRFAEVWHQEDIPGMLAQLGLEPPPVMIRLAAKRSARKYRKERRVRA